MTSWKKKKKNSLRILGKGKDVFVPAPPGEKRGIHISEEAREKWEGLYSHLPESLQNTGAKPRLLKHQLPPSMGSFR